MKRIVKFRGKSKRTGEWLYGDLVRNVEGAFAIVPPFEMTTDNLCDRYEVDEETIGQFTGCKCGTTDVEVYEGDIVSYKYLRSKISYKITFNNGSFCLGNISGSDYRPISEIFLKDVNVIGNIYDNEY